VSQHLKIIQRDDVLWSIGFHDDAPGPFEIREFVARVANGVPAETATAVKFRPIQIRYPADLDAWLAAGKCKSTSDTREVA
jgi:hypothetical protein